MAYAAPGTRPRPRRAGPLRPVPRHTRHHATPYRPAAAYEAGIPRTGHDARHDPDPHPRRLLRRRHRVRRPRHLPDDPLEPGRHTGLRSHIGGGAIGGYS